MSDRTELVDALTEIDLADTTRPGGIHGAVEQAAALIREHVEATHTGASAPIVPLNTTANRSTAA